LNSTQTVYQGKFIQVVEENINGIIWEKAHLKSAVIVYPFTTKGEIIFVKEFRPHETPNVRIKPVTGILEPQLSPIENANKELQEEIGIKANSLEVILSTTVTGSLNSTQHFILARDLVPSKIPNPDGEDTIQEVLYFSFHELMQKIHTMEIPWSLMTLGLFRLQYLIENKKIKL
jgi:8-oxo-dGTP pyrophosphatase MutT (NUDIX family)